MFSISPSAFGVYDSTWAMLGSWVGLLKREAPWLSIERVSDTSSLNITRLPVTTIFQVTIVMFRHCNIWKTVFPRNFSGDPKDAQSPPDSSSWWCWHPSQWAPAVEHLHVNGCGGGFQYVPMWWSNSYINHQNHFKWCLNMDEHGWASLSIHVVSRPAILLWKPWDFP